MNPNAGKHHERLNARRKFHDLFKPRGEKVHSHDRSDRSNVITRIPPRPARPAFGQHMPF